MKFLRVKKKGILLPQILLIKIFNNIWGVTQRHELSEISETIF